ncbi:methyltransferase domain-containing protein [Kutzneria chonburiensis]|uniref:Methyltransferase domain-containing protein n=1 Tax=Kutzneria chonburiensis TaxID=1483604 RepID=A0ABV6MKI9_9PSEU
MDYAMGRNDRETERLMLQAELYRPHSRHLFTLAGISPGMRVLDVGCGAGDISLLIADLVGPTGSVLGIDADPAVLAVARSRAQGLPNVEFRQAVLPSVELAGPVDAVVGRLILMHLADPAGTVRELARHVRPGGVVTFQDFELDTCRAAPPTALATRCLDWIRGSMRAGGITPNPGEDLYRIFRDAGFPSPDLSSSRPAGNADSVNVVHAAATAVSLIPMIEKAGLATVEEVGPETLYSRLRDEIAEVDGVFYSPELIAAWTTV